eukprot:763180-Hanusia_phi.AAC.3
MICLDVANGYSEMFVEYVRKVRKQFPDHIILAGFHRLSTSTCSSLVSLTVPAHLLSSIVILLTALGLEQRLASVLARFAQPASRLAWGIPSSQLVRGGGAGARELQEERKREKAEKIPGMVGLITSAAVIECADAAHGLGGHIISDGGCVCPGGNMSRHDGGTRLMRNAGDVAKAFGGGADFVMLGGMLAGHDECAGEMIEKNGKKRKLFYGPCSYLALFS